MKTAATLFFFVFISISSFAEKSIVEKTETELKEQVELKNLINHLFDNNTSLIREKPLKNKIIIMNTDHQKVRVGFMESPEKLNFQSTLVPLIYRAEFVTKIQNVSYYILKD